MHPCFALDYKNLPFYSAPWPTLSSWSPSKFWIILCVHVYNFHLINGAHTSLVGHWATYNFELPFYTRLLPYSTTCIVNEATVGIQLQWVYHQTTKIRIIILSRFPYPETNNLRCILNFENNGTLCWSEECISTIELRWRGTRKGYREWYLYWML